MLNPYANTPRTNCCNAPFIHEDLDICSRCYDHAEAIDDDED